MTGCHSTQHGRASAVVGHLPPLPSLLQDGSHIKGLLINFIHHNWPTLLKQPFLEQFITPIVKATKGKEEISFFSIPEFEEWKQNKSNWHTYKIKYYKGIYVTNVRTLIFFRQVW